MTYLLGFEVSYEAGWAVIIAAVVAFVIYKVVTQKKGAGYDTKIPPKREDVGGAGVSAGPTSTKG